MFASHFLLFFLGIYSTKLQKQPISQFSSLLLCHSDGKSVVKKVNEATVIHFLFYCARELQQFLSCSGPIDQ